MIVTNNYDHGKYLELCSLLASTANELSDAIRKDLPNEIKTEFEALKISIQKGLAKLEEIEQSLK